MAFEQRGLFEDGATLQQLGSAGSADAAPAGKSGEQKRRTKLYPWDSVASQLLNPYGKSVLDDVSCKALWKSVQRGSQKAAFHSELAAGPSIVALAAAARAVVALAAVPTAVASAAAAYVAVKQ